MGAHLSARAFLHERFDPLDHNNWSGRVSKCSPLDQKPDVGGHFEVGEHFEIQFDLFLCDGFPDPSTSTSTKQVGEGLKMLFPDLQAELNPSSTLPNVIIPSHTTRMPL